VTEAPGAPEEAVVRTWLSRGGYAVATFEPLSGDVSPRRYTRVQFADGSGAILASYPPEIADVCNRFQRTTELLAEAGVRVPRILTADCAAGFMLLEDLGRETLGDRRELPWSDNARYFATAQRLARRIAKLPADRVAPLSPVLDGEILRRELAQTWEHFLEPNGLVADSALAADLHAVLDELCAKIEVDPQVPCHRDFMARNLIPLAGGEVAVLDHQDLRLGPPLYDLASLFNDTVFPPAEAEDELLNRALPESRTGFHRTAAQRTLKAVGTYASFARRGATRHLPLIAPTLASCLRHMGEVPETHALVGDLARAWSTVLRPAQFSGGAGGAGGGWGAN
jgi:aminoglycoside/choline kinase family phosphotransferase